jgi:hypothetical protein
MIYSFSWLTSEAQFKNNKMYIYVISGAVSTLDPFGAIHKNNKKIKE